MCIHWLWVGLLWRKRTQKNKQNLNHHQQHAIAHWAYSLNITSPPDSAKSCFYLLLEEQMKPILKVYDKRCCLIANDDEDEGHDGYNGRKSPARWALRTRVRQASRVQGGTREMQSVRLERNPSKRFGDKSTWKYLASPLGLGKSVKTNTKVTEGGKKPSSSRPGVDTVSKQLSDWIFVQKRPRNKLLRVWND